MATRYDLSPIVQPQYVPYLSTQPLVLAPAGGTAVPAGFHYMIAKMRVANFSGVMVLLTVWRVPFGVTPSDLRNTVTVDLDIPVPTAAAPWFDLTSLWGTMLYPGDSIYASCNVSNGMSINADGVMVTL